MKISYYIKIISYIYFICILSCSDDQKKVRIETFHSEDGSFMVRSFFEDGSIKTETIYSSDSLLNGKAYGYYSNSKLKIERNYINGKKEGLTKGFFKNGEIEYIGQYKNDKKDSTWLWYNKEDARLDGIENFLNGDHFGGQLEFDRNGHLRWYKLFNLNGLLGKITFNESGVDIEGKLAFVWYNRDTLFEQEEFSSLLYLGVPPGWQSKFDFILIANDNKLSDKECCKISHIEKHNAVQYEMNCLFDELGNYKIKNILAVTDEAGIHVYKDTIETNVIVRK